MLLGINLFFGFEGNMTEITDLEKLPKEKQKVVAKVLYKMGWASKKIEEWLGISDTTIWRASELPTPEELKQFEIDFQVAVKGIKQEGIAKVLKRILEIIPKEKKLDQLVKAGEYLEGTKTPLVAQQFNIDEVKVSKEEYDRIFEGIED